MLLKSIASQISFYETWFWDRFLPSSFPLFPPCSFPLLFFIIEDLYILCLSQYFSTDLLSVDCNNTTYAYLYKCYKQSFEYTVYIVYRVF